jgi:probable F420-dependent oxidoreductase
MIVGAVFPQTQYGADPVAVREFAQTAEGLGYAHLLAYDHVLGAPHDAREPRLWGPYTEDDPFHEPLVLFGYLAGVTSRIELGTAVLVLPQRQTALVAKQAAEVDILSGGRLRLGVGVGWNYVEYEALGVDFRRRGARIEEQVELMRRLWAEPLIDYEGRWHRVDRASILPRPSRQIPVWFGGRAERAFLRAARIGEGFVFSRFNEDVLAAVARLRELLAEAGRDSGSFGIEVLLQYDDGPEAWERQFEACARAGVTHVAVKTISPAQPTPAAHIEALERFAAAVGVV